MMCVTQKFSLSQFKSQMGKVINRMNNYGEQVFLTRHGKVVAVLVPEYQARMIDAVMNIKDREKTGKIAEEYTRWKRAKAIEAHWMKTRFGEGSEEAMTAFEAEKYGGKTP